MHLCGEECTGTVSTTDDMNKQEIIAALRRELGNVVTERRSVKRDPEALAARVALRRFQAERMARTHVDLLEDRRSRAAVEFFLSDLYGPHDLSERDANLERALPSIEKLLPAPALAVVAEAVALDALSERLDAEMARRLGTGFTEADYIEAYRLSGARTDRERQLDHVERIGGALVDLVRMPFVAKTLSLMKTPARIAGVSHLQSFLERGFKAFQALEDPRRFIDIVLSRERQIMKQLFEEKKEPFALVLK